MTNATDGLLDLLKLTGDFSLVPDGRWLVPDGSPSHLPLTCILDDSRLSPLLRPGRVPKRCLSCQKSFQGQRVFVEPAMEDDVLEVMVNGQSAGVRLWEPYQIEVTDLLKPGENTLELRVANTLVNLLERVERPSGLAGAPRLVPYRTFTFDLKGS